MNKKWWQNAFLLVLIVSLLGSGSAVYAQEDDQQALAGKAPFNDVPAGHWAAKHIAKLAAQNIVMGTGAGKFGPNTNVSRQDAVIMAIRLLGKQGELPDTSTIFFPESFAVSDYAYSYVVLAFELGLLDRTEEFKRADAETEQQWGPHTASREWVTKLMIRAIGKTSLATELQQMPSGFADADMVGEGYAGYVNAAVSLGLMNGVSETRFDPQGSITRAMIAKMFSGAQAFFGGSYAGQLSGVLSARTDKSITLYDEESGSERMYTVGGDSLLYRHDGTISIALGELDLYTELTVIASGTSVRYAEQLEGEPQIETFDGELARYVPSESKLWLYAGDEYVDVRYDASLQLREPSGAELELDDLPIGSALQVTMDTFRETPLAVAIVVEGAPVNKTASGTVERVAGDELTVTEESSGATETWKVDEQAVITWNNQLRGLDDLAEGNAITYTVKNSVVTRIALTQTSGVTVTGEFYEAGADSKTIQYLIDGQPNVKFVGEDVEVRIEGLSDSDLSDLVRGDRIVMTVNERNEVVSVVVQDRQVEYINGANIMYDYEKDSGAIIVKDGAGTVHAIELDKDTRIDFAGTKLTLDAAAGMLVKNRKVTIGYTDNKAVTLEFLFSYTGELTKLGTSAKTLTMRVDNGSTLELDMLAPSVEVRGKANATLSDVAVGDRITARLGGAEQDQVVTILVHDTVQRQVVSVNAASNRIELKTGTQPAETLNVQPSWRVAAQDGTALTLADLQAGDLLHVEYAGTQPVALIRVEVTIGKLTAVGADELTLRTASGATKEVELSGGVQVKKSGLAYTGTSALGGGDWVKLTRDAYGRATVEVLAPLTHQFRMYDAGTQQLYVLATRTGDPDVKFKVTSSSLLYDGSDPITMDALTSGDELTIYAADGVLLEASR
ncbi:S-layer homology domain-containing protein [Paenibacillus sp. IB182496]|uniref:S-layer homology domain-containing protein n=1 Tax=Paenibacillus sabuli TaxID=2772509 RepID=A0A927BT74_9BACL|nr:S-layer homology domain-containing protein [Paenibacillus sabuli]MBD2845089.1 S-layer homology domain-containing protein [Paenibacillus sabuli]